MPLLDAWHCSWHLVLQVGRNEIVMVIRVDRDKGTFSRCVSVCVCAFGCCGCVTLGVRWSVLVRTVCSACLLASAPLLVLCLWIVPWIVPWMLCARVDVWMCHDAACIDLSKRRVTPEDRAKCEERYNKASLVRVR